MKLKLSLLTLLLPFALSCGSDDDNPGDRGSGSAYSTAFFAQFDQGCDCGFDDFCAGEIRDAAETSVLGGEDCLNTAAAADPAVATQLACFTEHSNSCANASCGDDFVDCVSELPDCGTQEQAITDCLATQNE